MFWGGLFNLNFVIFTGKQLPSLLVISLLHNIQPHLSTFHFFYLPYHSNLVLFFVTSLASKIKPIIGLLGKKAVRKSCWGQVQSLLEYSNINQVG
jgi:hypothetical protein